MRFGFLMAAFSLFVSVNAFALKTREGDPINYRTVVVSRVNCDTEKEGLLRFSDGSMQDEHLVERGACIAFMSEFGFKLPVMVDIRVINMPVMKVFNQKMVVHIGNVQKFAGPTSSQP